MPKPLTETELHDLRDQVEAKVQVAIDKGMRSFLRRTTQAAIAQPSLVASVRDDMVTLGQVSGWWAATVDADILNAIRAQWMTVYRRIHDGTITATSLDGLDDYMARVRDRLVRGLIPPVGDDAFNHVRLAITQGTTEGWTRRQTAARIAADLGWETDGPYWRAEKARADAAIDAILDPLGPPGHPVREATRLTDPRVAALQRTRAQAVKALDSEAGYWQNRATRIATTEATGANNYAHLSALIDEEMPGKEWISAGDSRTRPSHQTARGQVVPVEEPFIVGGATLMFPGDPAGPAKEVIRCRCVIVGAELPDDLATDPLPLTPDTEAFDAQWGEYPDDPPTGTVYAQTAHQELRYAKSFTPDEWDTWVDDADGASPIAMFNPGVIRALDPDALEDMVSGWETYTSTGFYDINRALRGITASDLDRVGQTGDIARMDAMFENIAPSLTQDRFLFRYLDATPDFNPANFTVGETFTDAGFVSTTLGQGRVEAFGDWSFLIRVPSGTRVLFGDSDEWEVILDRGSRFRVVSIDHDLNRVNVEYLGTNAKSEWEA